MAITSFTGSYRFLSNFYPSPVHFDGWTYYTLEHAYQAAKTDDWELRERMSQLHNPVTAKRLGRELPLRPGWGAMRIAVMQILIATKFSPHRIESQWLLDTGDEELIEGNTWNDTFWGVCNGTGANWLGRLLMERRAFLRGC